MTPGAFVGVGLHRFLWQEPWRLGKGRGTRRPAGWAHHGIVVTDADEVITPHPDRPEMLVLDTDGSVIRSWPLDVVQAHGLTLVREGGVQYLWIADNGSVRVRQEDGSFSKVGRSVPVEGAAVKYTLDGTEVLRLATPNLPIYESADYAPTQVAVTRTGDIWVADGYGQHLVHRYDSCGRYLASLDGSEGAGEFRQPHAVFVDHRGMEPELLVADRANRRIQVFDQEGSFILAFGEDFLVSPSGFAAWGEYTIIAELDGRLTVVDQENKLVGYLGETQDQGRSRPGWPNAMSGTASVRPPLSAGRFNSPHGIAVDASLNVYVSEFVVGGRLVKLEHFGSEEMRK